MLTILSKMNSFRCLKFFYAQYSDSKNFKIFERNVASLFMIGDNNSMFLTLHEDSFLKMFVGIFLQRRIQKNLHL